MNHQPRNSNRRIKKKKQNMTIILILVVLISAILILVGGGLSYLHNTSAFNAEDIKTYDVEVKKGASTKSIANTLKEMELINNTTAFQYYVKSNGYDGKLRAGHYALSPSMTIEEITYELLNGVGETQRFTIPEGYTLSDICSVFVAQEIMSQEEFWDIIMNFDFSYDFLDGLPNNEHRLEGFLFPDTYIIAVNSSPIVVINAMLTRFQQIYDRLPENKSGLNFYDTLKLASLIESESRTDEDRPLVASVYLNRLEKNMPLQCDATIIYAMPERKTRLFYSDYQYDSPYNTYLNSGFPPTPISNPGEKSLLAAFEPATTEYFYYLWDKTAEGGHVFAKTYAEHLQNRKTYGYN